MLADVVGDPTGDVDVAVVQQCAVADDNFVAIGMGDNALTSDHVEIVRIGNRLEAGVRIVRLGDRRPTVRRSSRALAGRVDDGVGEVVFALLLGGRREREDLVISNAEPLDVGDGALALRECPRFVEGDEVDLAGAFEVFAALHQHARPGGVADGRDDADRRPDD